MNRLHIFTALALAMAAGPAAGQALEPDAALKSLLSEAVSANPDIAAWQQRLEAATQQVPQAGAWADPMLSLGLMNLPVNTPAFNREPMTGAWVNLSQAVPLGGKPAARTEVARSRRDAAEGSLESRRLRVAATTASAWFDWAYIREALRVTQTDIALLEQMVAITTTKYETGRGLQSDILRARTELSRLQDREAALEQASLTAGRRLAVLLGREPQVSPAPPEGLTDHFAPLDSASLAGRLLEENPEWDAARARAATAAAKRELAARMWLPDLKLTAGYGYRGAASTGANRSDFFSISVGATLPVWGGRKQSRAVAEAESRRRAAQLELTSLRHELLFRLQRLLDEDDRLARQIELYRVGVEPQARGALTAVTSAYTVGSADFEALLTAQQALLRARLERMMRVRDRLKVRAELAALVAEL